MPTLPAQLENRLREAVGSPGSGEGGALESGEPGSGTQLLCDLESLSLGLLVRNTGMKMPTLPGRCGDQE